MFILNVLSALCPNVLHVFENKVHIKIIQNHFLNRSIYISMELI